MAEKIKCPSDKAECLNLYEEAVDLIDSLNSEQRIDYGDYSLLRDAVDAIGNCIEENRQPPTHGYHVVSGCRNVINTYSFLLMRG